MGPTLASLPSAVTLTSNKPRDLFGILSQYTSRQPEKGHPKHIRKRKGSPFIYCHCGKCKHKHAWECEVDQCPCCASVKVTRTW